MFRIKHQQGPRAVDPQLQSAGRHLPTDKVILEKLRAGLERSDRGEHDQAFVNSIGEFGEQLAVTALKRMGFAVFWVNQFSETGLPFDLLIRPCRPEDLANEEKLGNVRKYFADLFPQAKGGVEKLAQDFSNAADLLDCTALLEGTAGDVMKQTGTIMIEVKASIARKKEFFEIGLNELVAAWRHAANYWVVRIEGLAEEMHEIRIVKDLPESLKTGASKLWLVA